MTVPSAETAILELPPVASIGALEEAVDVFYQTVPPSVADLELDMRPCKFIEPASMIFLCSLIRQRELADRGTRLRLPLAKQVRDALRIWEFPQAIRDAVGRTFFSLVAEEDRHFFGENQDADDLEYPGRRVSIGGKNYRLLSKLFFAIRTFFPAHIASRKSAADQEKEQWKEGTVTSILDHHLGGNGEHISSHIIYEAFFNSLRHPNAQIVQTTSFFQAPKGERQDGLLTIVFWDDGESIIHTLRRAVVAGTGGRFLEAPELYAAYHCRIVDDGGRETRQTMTPEESLTASSPFWSYLVGAIFPGVTSDLSGAGHAENVDLSNKNKLLSLPGMGLYVLTDMASAVLGGSIAIRTDQFFMNVKARNSKAYDVKIKLTAPSRGPFLGNMLTIRLPLRPAQSASAHS